jgi:hypothetical protein
MENRRDLVKVGVAHKVSWLTDLKVSSFQGYLLWGHLYSMHITFTLYTSIDWCCACPAAATPLLHHHLAWRNPHLSSQSHPLDGKAKQHHFTRTLTLLIDKVTGICAIMHLSNITMPHYPLYGHRWGGLTSWPRPRGGAIDFHKSWSELPGINQKIAERPFNSKILPQWRGIHKSNPLFSSPTSARTGGSGA